ncbi:T0004742 isoform 2 [Pan troglodytes]|uniref:T0004742 isoform 2 n=1 Tax=Pan troglodytes TaxID=9598 RepID=A0A2J8PQP0_PANTR|nr:T0004742 isoform 2 [Pan troglodytes]
MNPKVNGMIKRERIMTSTTAFGTDPGFPGTGNSQQLSTIPKISLLQKQGGSHSPTAPQPLAAGCSGHAGLLLTSLNHD